MLTPVTPAMVKMAILQQKAPNNQNVEPESDVESDVVDEPSSSSLSLSEMQKEIFSSPPA